MVQTKILQKNRLGFTVCMMNSKIKHKVTKKIS